MSRAGDSRPRRQNRLPMWHFFDVGLFKTQFRLLGGAPAAAGTPGAGRGVCVPTSTPEAAMWETLLEVRGQRRYRPSAGLGKGGAGHARGWS